MLYEYECSECNHKFEVIKNHDQHREPSDCPKCSGLSQRVMSLFLPMSESWHEYNHGLGCYTKGAKDRDQIAKQKGLIEVGNEPVEKIHSKMEKVKADKLSWDNVI